jgi:hypothetical protein
MNLQPTIGLSGVFKLADPFAAKMLKNVVYQCVAVRRIDELILSGTDPFKTYYAPNNISITKYEADVATDVMIVSLKAIGTQEVVHVPNTYITSCPQAGGVAYTAIGAAVSLGALPNNTNLDYLSDLFKKLVRETLGVVATVNYMSMSPTEVVTDTTHESLVIARNELISNTPTDRSQLLKTLAELQAAKQKVIELEQYIITLGLPDTTVTPP